MNKKNLNIALFMFLALMLLSQFAVVAYAQTPSNLLPPDVGLPGNPSSSITGVIGGWIRVIFLPIAGAVAVLFIIIGGFQYMTSAGNEELAERGKKTLQNGIIGLVIIILSYMIVTVIYNALFLRV